MPTENTKTTGENAQKPKVIECSDLLATTYKIKADYNAYRTGTMTIHRMNSPFYDGDKWSVRLRGDCLNKESEWEWEPNPSSRGDDFYERCRFDSLEDALSAINNLS